MVDKAEGSERMEVLTDSVAIESEVVWEKGVDIAEAPVDSAMVDSVATPGVDSEVSEEAAGSQADSVLPVVDSVPGASSVLETPGISLSEVWIPVVAVSTVTPGVVEEPSPVPQSEVDVKLPGRAVESVPCSTVL